MANNPNLGGWGRQAWNSGSWNTPSTVPVTGVSAATAVGAIQVDITVPVTGVSSAAQIGTAVATVRANVSITGVSAATAVGNTQVDITVPITGVEASALVGRVNIWQVIVPGQDARWDPVTYTQSPNWTKIAA